MEPRWVDTVVGLMTSWAATWALVRPWATRRRTSTSRSVRPAGRMGACAAPPGVTGPVSSAGALIPKASATALASAIAWVSERGRRLGLALMHEHRGQAVQTAGQHPAIAHGPNLPEGLFKGRAGEREIALKECEHAEVPKGIREGPLIAELSGYRERFLPVH